MGSDVTAVLRRSVIERAQGKCEYCTLHQDFSIYCHRSRTNSGFDGDRLDDSSIVEIQYANSGSESSALATGSG
jgi:hypothetical protein